MVKQIGNPYFIAAIAVIGGALFGFDISSMSAIIATQVCVETLHAIFYEDSRLTHSQPYKCYFNQQGFNDAGQCIGPRAAVQGGITASMAAGSWLAALCSGFLSDRLGRT
jgi:hypothetical protein